MTAAPDAAPSPKISPQAFGKARLCVAAARMREEHKTFTAIACELGLADPATAERAADVGRDIIDASMRGGW